MAEQQVTPQAIAQPAAQPSPQPEAAPVKAEGTHPGTAPDKGGEKMFSQAEMNAIINDRLARASEKAAKEAEKARTDAERKAAEEQGQFKQLYEQVKAEAEKAKAEAEQVRLESLRDRVGREAGLPEIIAKRLSGATEEELRADAAILAAALPKPVTGGTDAGKGTASSKAVPSIYSRYGSKEEMGARLGLNPKYLPD